MEKQKIMPSIDEAIERVKDLKISHSDLYRDAIDVVLDELTVTKKILDLLGRFIEDFPKIK